jgi:drug/metabolite transporter (DMT)-like permease
LLEFRYRCASWHNAGTVLVAVSDHIVGGNHSETEGPWRPAVLGDVMTVASAALYALFTLLVKAMMPEESEGDLMLFFGALGVVNAIAFTPVLLMMHCTGAIDVFSVTRETVSIAVLKGACISIF